MAEKILYVYAIGRPGTLSLPGGEGVGGSREFTIVEEGDLAALCSRVDADLFSQEQIDARANDLEWLGSVGYRHQEIVAGVREAGDAIPLRAFVLFSSEAAVREYLGREADELGAILDQISGRDEWTFEISFDDERWKEAIEHRSAPLAELRKEIESAAPGRAYLLRKKLNDRQKQSAREAEQSLLGEIESALTTTLQAPAIQENRLKRGGSFPQISVLIDRSRQEEIETLEKSLSGKYADEGVRLTLSGPWPPYTFVRRETR